MEFRTLRPNPANVGGSRPLSAIDMILVHCTQGDTAAGAANWWARRFIAPGSNGSAHVVFDDDVMYRAVDDNQVAYGARGYNYQGLHIEIAGWASWSRDTWLSHMPRLEGAAAFQAAGHKLYGVPFRESTSNGYHSHAGLPGNDHTDPGPNFPWDVYVPRVKAHLDGQITQPPPKPLEDGGTLRLILSVTGVGPYVEVAGWAEALPVMQQLAASGFKRPADKEIVFTWRGGTWRSGGQWGGDSRDVLPVIRTVLNQYGPKENA